MFFLFLFEKKCIFVYCQLKYIVMEKLVLQTHESAIERTESFISAVCGKYHLDNYYAIISVPVLKAMNHALSTRQMPVVVTFDYSKDGICFNVSGPDNCFNNLKETTSPLPSQIEDDMILIGRLSDAVSFSDDGSSMKIVFNVRGIDSREAMRRISVFESVYRHSDIPAEVAR